MKKSVPKDKDAIDKAALEKWALPILQQIAKVILVEDYAPLKIKFGLEQSHTYAECINSYPYKSITISYGKDMLEDFKPKKYKGILPTLIHEMCHPLTDPIFNKSMERWTGRQELLDERENLTDHIANIIIKSELIDLPIPSRRGT